MSRTADWSVCGYDCLSLGVVFWELMVQVFPYPKLPEMVVLLGVGQGKVALPLPDTFPPDFKKLLQSVFTLMKCKQVFTVLLLFRMFSC